VLRIRLGPKLFVVSGTGLQTLSKILEKRFSLMMPYFIKYTLSYGKFKKKTSHNEVLKSLIHGGILKI
jgi:hypothetical protein